MIVFVCRLFLLGLFFVCVIVDAFIMPWRGFHCSGGFLSGTFRAVVGFALVEGCACVSVTLCSLGFLLVPVIAL